MDLATRSDSRGRTRALNAGWVICTLFTGIAILLGLSLAFFAGLAATAVTGLDRLLLDVEIGVKE
jgi:hypothetical protein